MRVNEIFYSLSGEGVHAGIPTVFVRLVGCNLDCTYCDTQYALDPKDAEELTFLDIIGCVNKFMLGEAGWVLITGGEPLTHYCKELVIELRRRLYRVEIETNGSIDPPGWFNLVHCWSVDVKCPSSGLSYGSFRPRWLKRLRKQDQLKFVVGTQEDLDFVKGFLNEVSIKPTVLISPITVLMQDKKQGTVQEYWNRDWLQECADFCKEHDVRMSLQLHKIVYGDKKGV